MSIVGWASLAILHCSCFHSKRLAVYRLESSLWQLSKQFSVPAHMSMGDMGYPAARLPDVVAKVGHSMHI